jgi:hypothetical protein
LNNGPLWMNGDNKVYKFIHGANGMFVITHENQAVL